MINKYIFTLSSQGNKLHAHSQQNGHDISIVCEEEDNQPPYFSFTSQHLSSLVKPEEVWARALSLLSIYNGVSNLFCDVHADYNDISSQRLIDMYIWEKDEKITPYEHKNIPQSYPFDKNLILDEHLLSKNNSIDYIIHLSKTNTDVLHILLQLGNGLEWINLYSIYDSVKTYSNQFESGYFNIVLTGSNHNTQDIKAFTGTVNNYGILGVKARHGELGFGIPQNTLNLKDAQSLILDLCKSYFKLRHEI